MCVWIEDADAIEFNEDALDIVYYNEMVKNYLYGKHVLGISGIKGQGKTFLIKVKRKMLQGSNGNTRDAIVCFPKDSMVDQLDSAMVINKQLHNYLQDFSNWISIWKISIAITIINSLEFDHVFEKKDILDLSNEMQSILQINNKDSRPSVIFTRLMRQGKKELSKVVYDTVILMDILRRIKNGVCLFIDKLDQAFRIDIHKIKGDARNASYWQYCQYSLACAAYEIYSSNNHIKVYYTIRKEALIDSHKLASNIKRNVNSYISNLSYNKLDIKKMFDIYIENEDNTNLAQGNIKTQNHMKAFVGVDIIEHGFVKSEETVWDYIYRHTLKRPYDIMKICKALYLNKDEISKEVIRRTTNATAKEILESYLEELSPFISCSIFDIENALFLLNTNIFDLNYLHYVCYRFNIMSDKINECTLNCESCEKLSVFPELYNIGLLGYIDKSDNDNKYKQKFNSIGSSIFMSQLHDIPESKFYFLHPCLTDLSKLLRNKKGFEFKINTAYLVGDEMLINRKKDNQINKHIDKCLTNFNNEKVFISSTIHDLKSERNAIMSVLSKRGYLPVMSDSRDFYLNGKEVNNKHSHDHCIDEILKCKHLISIIGKEFGGEYSGDKYEKYIEEIKQKSNEKISKPSISLVEFYAAKKHDIITYVFILDSFDSDKSSWSDKKRDEYNFMNHLSMSQNKIKGNWIIRYKDENELTNRVNNLILNVSY